MTCFSKSTTINLQCHKSTPLRELHQCSVCQHKTARKSNLKKHYMTHTKEKPFQCYKCNFCAATKCTLVLHLRSHTGEKPYECAICQRRFARRNVIKAHIKTHSTDKPFKCSECSFVTSRKDNLKFHKRRHLKDKPFKCQICTSTFVQKCRFKRHLETHTNAYNCYSCYYKTHLDVNLFKHKLNHLNMNLLVCFVCGKDFRKKCGIRAHILRLHTRKEICAKITNYSVQMAELAKTSIETYKPKTYTDKSVSTDELNEINVSQEIDLATDEPKTQLLICSSNNCVLDCNYNPESATIESNQDMEECESEYYDSSEGSSDSDTDVVKSPSNIDLPGSAINQTCLPNVTVINPDVLLNYQPANYLLGLNMVQPLVLPSISLQPNLISTSPVVLTAGFNNTQLNQDISYVPICNDTNLYVNSYVPNVVDTNVLLNINCDPTRTVFVNEMY